MGRRRLVEDDRHHAAVTDDEQDGPDHYAERPDQPAASGTTPSGTVSRSLAGASLLAPGGLMIVATLNRTLKAFALAKLGAEYVLRWLPVGTHDWKKFIKPVEILEFLQGEPVSIAGPFGVSYDPFSGRWGPSGDTQVNYMMTVDKSAAV